MALFCGRAEPLGVRFRSVGNESWGCGGSMTPDYYADVNKRCATFLRSDGSVSPFRVATAAAGGDCNRTEVMIREAGHMIDVVCGGSGSTTPREQLRSSLTEVCVATNLS